MDVESLRQMWQEQDRKLDEILRANARAGAGPALARAEAAARRERRGILLELVLAAVPVLWLGSFVADRIAEPRFWIPAAALDVLAILTLAAHARAYAAARSIDWTAPVAAIQSRLSALRVRRARVTRWIFLLGPLLWAPMLVVALRGFLGVDAYASFGGGFIAANVLFGAVFLAAGLWISRRYAGRLRTHPLLTKMLRDLAGRNLAEAEEFAAAAGGFARPDGPR